MYAIVVLLYTLGMSHTPAPLRAIVLLLLTLISQSTVLASSRSIPVEAFAQLPDVSGLTISPDGRNIAALVRVNVQGLRGTALTIYNVESGKNKTLTASDNKKFVMNWLEWANDDTLLLSARFPSARDGIKVIETRLMKVDIKSGEIKPTLPASFLRRLNWLPTQQDNVVSLLREDENGILLSARLQPSLGTEVIRIDLKKGFTRKIQRVKADVFDWHVDRDDVIRIAVRFKGTTSTYLYRDSAKDAWKEIYAYEELSADQVNVLGFGADRNEVYFGKYLNDKMVIYKGDIRQGFEDGEVVHSDPKYDVYGQLVFSKRLNKVVGLDHGFGEQMTFWDDEFQALQKSINHALRDTINSIVDIADDERKILILSSSSTDPGMYYLWDRDKASMVGVAERYGKLHPDLMAEPVYIEYSARDGTKINGYLTLPKGQKAQNLPTIIFPHGGPISHDTDGFDYWTQYFASRGYAVLQMNFRGSSGYGYDFMSSGFTNWGNEMQLDVEDGTRWLIDEGIADKNRICVVGASYGGYAALMEAASGNGLYQCAISFAAVTDLPLLLRSYRRFNTYSVAKKMLGGDRKVMNANSPVSKADTIQIPILLVHGDKDRRVDVKHSRDMARALEKSGKPFDYIELEKGTHFLGNEEHRLAFFRAMDAFLSKHLSTQTAK